ncbi:hypothetical protein LINPERPRIM_LOCUS9898 [Linum perenne]
MQESISFTSYHYETQPRLVSCQLPGETCGCISQLSSSTTKASFNSRPLIN